MTDFKTGDRVRWIEQDNTFGIKVGTEGTVVGCPESTGMVVLPDGMENVDWYGCGGRAVVFSQNSVELINPIYAPGTRIRGVVEGVVSVGGHMVITDSVGDVSIAKLNDITVIKTLPTAPSSVIEWNEVLFTLTGFKTRSGKPIWWPITGRNEEDKYDAAAIEYYGREFGDNWTLRFDAGAK